MAYPYPKNTNVLEGIACPDCGNEDDFHILVKGMAHVNDDGVTEVIDPEWDLSSFCICLGCDKEGTVDDFWYL